MAAGSAASPAASSVPSWLASEAVPRRSWDDPEVRDFLRRGQPVVLTGCPLVARLHLRWDFQRLSKVLEAKELGVHRVPGSVFARHYGVGLGEGAVVPMRFTEFEAAVAARETAASYYLQARVERPCAADESSQPLDADLALIDWDWLDEARRLRGAAESDGDDGGGEYLACQLWAGHGLGSTPCHYDARDNFLAQVAGRKRAVVFPTSHSLELYPYPLGHVLDNFAMADVLCPDLERFPAMARARGAVADLGPGDVLWLPRYWWHHVQQRSESQPDKENISLSFWFGGKGNGAFGLAQQEASRHPLPATPAPRPEEWEAADAALTSALRRPGAALRAFQVGRHAEAVAAATCGGPRAGGEFLTALAAGEDAAWGASSSAARVAGRLRAQLAALLLPALSPRAASAEAPEGGAAAAAAAAAAALLRAMTRDGRLHPGPPPVDGPVESSDALSEG